MKARIIFSVCFALLTLSAAYAQRDLRDRKIGIQKASERFNTWLRNNEVEDIFKIDSVQILAHKVTLHLGPVNDELRCDSLKYALQVIEIENFKQYGNYYEGSMQEEWERLTGLSGKEVEVEITCGKPIEFRVKAFTQMPKNAKGTVAHAEAYRLKQVSKGVQVTNTGDNEITVSDIKAAEISKITYGFFENWYSKRGTWLWGGAELKALLNVDDELLLEATYIKKDIISDGYFERHLVHITFKQKGKDVILNMNFKGEYGSGIIFAPRTADYKDMAPAYQKELDMYNTILFKSLTFEIKNHK